MKRMKKRLTACLLAAICLLSGCGGGQADGQDERPPDTVKVSGGYFGLAHYDNGALNPVTENTAMNRLLCEAMYEGLFEVGENFTAVPVLCADYTGDGTTFTFTLKDGVTFWSGAALTAQDVVSCLEAAQTAEASPYYARMQQVSSIAAVGDKQVRIVLSSPNINFPRLLDIPIFRAGENETFPDGTGPFRPTEESGKWSLTANENWQGGYLGSIRKISLVTVSRADAAVSSFETGDVSLMRTERISSGSTIISGLVDAVQTASADLHYLGVNMNHSQLKNAAVRCALSAAIGRKNLCETQLQTFADPAILPVNPQPSGDNWSLNMQADTERATALLAEAKLEEPLAITLLVNSDNAFKTAAADQIAAAWRAIGVQVTVQKVEYSAFTEAVQNGNFDVYYGETLLMPDFDLRPLLSSGGALNYGGYSSAAADTAMASARRGEDLNALYQQLLDDMPIVPIAFERQQLVLRQGLIDSLPAAPYNAFAGVENWRTGENK